MKRQVTCPRCGAMIDVSGKKRQELYSSPEDVKFIYELDQTVYVIGYARRYEVKIIARNVRKCHGRWLPWYKVEPLYRDEWFDRPKWLSGRMLGL